MAGISKKAEDTVARKLAESVVAENAKDNNNDDVDISVNKQGMKMLKALNFIYIDYKVNLVMVP